MANTYTQIYVNIVFAVELLEKFGVDYDSRFLFKDNVRVRYRYVAAYGA